MLSTTVKTYASKDWLKKAYALDYWLNISGQKGGENSGLKTVMLSTTGRAYVVLTLVKVTYAQYYCGNILV